MKTSITIDQKVWTLCTFQSRFLPQLYLCHFTAKVASFCLTTGFLKLLLLTGPSKPELLHRLTEAKGAAAGPVGCIYRWGSSIGGLWCWMQLVCTVLYCKSHYLYSHSCMNHTEEPTEGNQTVDSLPSDVKGETCWRWNKKRREERFLLLLFFYFVCLVFLFFLHWERST